MFPFPLENSDLREHLSRIQPLTDAAWTALEDLFDTQEIVKNEYLLREGERAYHCYLLRQGIVRVYYNAGGNEYNKTFFTPGSFPTALTSLLTQTPSRLNFQALSDCVLIRFSYASFRALFGEHRCLETLMLRVMEMEWINKEKHDIEMVTNGARDNYEIFLETYPGLEQEIAQYHIASYLGVTPIQLSRIRSQKSSRI